MTHYHRRMKPAQHEYNLRWWLVPLALGLLSLAAWLATPQLEERARQAPHALPTAPPGLSPEFPLGVEAPVNETALAAAPVLQGSAVRAAELSAVLPEEERHAPHF